MLSLSVQDRAPMRDSKKGEIKRTVLKHVLHVLDCVTKVENRDASLDFRFLILAIEFLDVLVELFNGD